MRDVRLTVLAPEGTADRDIQDMITAGLSRPPAGWLVGSITVEEEGN
jgi:hypothetical protein